MKRIECVVKGGIATLGTIITYMTDAFTPLILIMVIFMGIDYITGMLSAALSDGFSSKEARKGTIKKLTYFFVVAIAFGFDFVIFETTKTIGLNFQWKAIFGMLSICWLISTDGISILENLVEIGLPIPKFLLNGLKLFKEKVEELGEGEGTLYEHK